MLKIHTFKRLRKTVVEYPAHTWVVHTHTECNSGGENQDVAICMQANQ